MKININVTQKDLFEYKRSTSTYKDAKLMFNYLVPFCFGGILIGMHMITGVFNYYAFFIFLGVYLVSYILGCFFYDKYTLRKYKRSLDTSSLLGKTIIELQNDRLAIKTDGLDFSIDWKKLNNIRETRDYIYLSSSAQLICVIPKDQIEDNLDSILEILNLR